MLRESKALLDEHNAFRSLQAKKESLERRIKHEKENDEIDLNVIKAKVWKDFIFEYFVWESFWISQCEISQALEVPLLSLYDRLVSLRSNILELRLWEIANEQTAEDILKERKGQIKLYAESAASYRQAVSDLKKNAILGLGMMEINGQVSWRQKI